MPVSVKLIRQSTADVFLHQDVLSSLSIPEDPYAFLRTFDAVFVIDDSGSMADRFGTRSRKPYALLRRSISPITIIALAFTS